MGISAHSRSGQVTALVAASLAVVVAAIALRNSRTYAMDRVLAAEKYEDVFYGPPTRWLPAMSLGYREALADLYWMKALLYYNDELKERGHLVHVFSYVDSIVELDPDFRAPYMWVGTAALYHTHAPTREYAERAAAVVRAGVDRFPDDGEMAWQLGATLGIELAPLLKGEPTEHARVKAEAVEYMERAARLGAGPDWLVLANAGELLKLGKREQAIHHLEEMYASVRDPETKEKILAQLQNMRGAARIEQMREYFVQYEAQWRAEFPFVDPWLYLWVRRPQNSEISAVASRLKSYQTWWGALPESTEPAIAP